MTKDNLNIYGNSLVQGNTTTTTKKPHKHTKQSITAPQDHKTIPLDIKKEVTLTT